MAGIFRTSSNGIFLHFPCLVTTFNYAVHAKVVPQNGAQEREESAEGMSPLVMPGHETQQKIRQQGCPYLPSDGVLAVSEEVRELKRLLDLLEEHLHAPATPVELADSVGRPVEAVRDEGHLRLVPPDIDLRPHQPDLLRIKLAGAFPRQTDAPVGQDRAVLSGVLALACRLLSHISGSLPRLGGGPSRACGAGGGALPACRPLSCGLKEDVFLEAGHPDYAAAGERMKVPEVDVCAVEHDDLAGPQPRAQLPGGLRIRVAGALDDGDAGHEGAHVQDGVHLGSRLLRPVPRPADAVRRQLDGRGIDRPYGPVPEPVRQAGVVPAAAHELGMVPGKCLACLPEELLRHGGRPGLAGVGQAVAAWRRAVACLAQVACMVGQAVADVVQAQRMGEMRIDQRHHMTVGAERARGYLVLLRQIFHYPVRYPACNLRKNGHCMLLR